MELRDQLQATLGGAYTLEHELGGGGMSRVFTATETALGRKVVVKVLPPETAAGVSADRFKREIQLAAQLQHPHIVPVLAAGEMDGLPYYTMPFVDGASLRDRLARGGALSIGESVSVLRDVAKALAYAHERGIVHRDVKPDNVLLTGGSAVVTDFGIAKAISASRTASSTSALTQVGTSLGTPAYMAPEQAAADPATDFRADLYSFGCLAYELLAGRPPFVGRTPQKLLAAQMGERPQPITELRPDTPPLLAELVMRCLEKEASARPQSAADLVKVLEAVTTSGGAHQAMPAILLGGQPRLPRVLLTYAFVFAAAYVLAKAAVIGIGLPSWVLPATVIVMALGLPVVLFTAFVHRGARRAMTMATLTPGGSPTRQGTMTRLAVKASPWVNWRRTTLGGAWALGLLVVAIAVWMTLRALGIGPAGSLIASGALRAEEPILVADFRVGGADSTLGPVVAEAVRTDLGGSNAFSVVPTSQVNATLRLMQHAGDMRLDLPLAREVAQRNGVRAIVTGELAPIGAGYLITLRLVSAASGDELTSFRQTIDGPTGLIPALDKLTRDLRGKMGESLRSVQEAPSLAAVTTTSLPALRKYTEGVNALDVHGDIAGAITLLREAVGIDSTFAMAWRKLAVAYGNENARQSQIDWAAEHAYRYRDHLTDFERAMTVGYFFTQTSWFDRPRAIAAYEQVLAAGDTAQAANNTAILYNSLHEYARAEQLLGAEIRHSPGTGQPWDNLMEAQAQQGKLAAIDTTMRAMERNVPNSLEGLRTRMAALYVQGRFADLARLTDSTMRSPTPGVRISGLEWDALTSAAHGHVAEAERVDAQIGPMLHAMGIDPVPFQSVIRRATLDAAARDKPTQATALLDSALAAHPLRELQPADRPDYAIASTYALAGHPEKARAILATYATEVRDTGMARANQPLQHRALAEIAIAEGKGADAVREARLAWRLPDGPSESCLTCEDVLLGRAFDKAGQPDSAIAHFTHYATTPDMYKGILIDPVFEAAIYHRLGELYENKGDRADAVTWYTKFVDLWKTADPELQPRVADVRRHLAKLTDTEARK